MDSRTRRISSFASILPLSAAPAFAVAAGFSLLEQTGSGVGTAYAGAAASADDISAMYFNPASLALLDSPQLAVALHGIDLETEFEDRGSLLPPAGLGISPGAVHSDAGDLIPVPNAYVGLPINERFAAGLAVNAPFGLTTEYDDMWIGRFQGIRSELITVNVNPAVSYRLNDAVLLGAGVNYQRAEAELSNAVLLAPGVEGRALLDVDDDAWGWNAGALFNLPSQTRVGISYRSRLDYTLSGDTNVATLTGLPVALPSGPTSADITFPDSLQLSAAQPLGNGIELRADALWMNWSEVDTVLALNPATGLPRDVLQFGFEDTIRLALGASYRWNDRWTFRAGAAWDESPVRDELRTVRLPDSDRAWLTFGARWRPLENLTVDAGYAHLFVDDTEIDLTHGQSGAPASFASTVRGTYDAAVDILSVQMSWSFR